MPNINNDLDNLADHGFSSIMLSRYGLKTEHGMTTTWIASTQSDADGATQQVNADTPARAVKKLQKKIGV